MSLELYFAELISNSGAEELVLESDNAAANSPPATKKRILSRNSKRQLNAGPPNCPLRQVSRDDLYAMPLSSSNNTKRSLRSRQHHHYYDEEEEQPQQQQQQQGDGLKDFYNEVAPGRRPLSKPTTSLSLSSLPPLSSNASYNANLLLAPGVMSELFATTTTLPPPPLPRKLSMMRPLLNNNNKNNNNKHKRMSRSTSDEPRRSICEYLDEVQNVVNGNRDDSALNDRRWVGSQQQHSRIVPQFLDA